MSPKIKQKMQEIVTPIFNKEMGERMSVVRMKNMMDQQTLAKALGVSQSVISDLEIGRIAVTRKPITLAQFEAVFGPHLNYIFFGTHEERYNVSLIKTRYWDLRRSRDPIIREQLGKKPVKEAPATGFKLYMNSRGEK